MRKVKLRMSEQEKYSAIKKVVDTNGNKKRTALKLGISLRTVNRLIMKYKSNGKETCLHFSKSDKARSENLTSFSPTLTFPNIPCPSSIFPEDFKGIFRRFDLYR